MARKRQYNTVRTDTLESKIAHYTALRDYNAAEALRRLAREIGAPIDDHVIATDVAERRKVYER